MPYTRQRLPHVATRLCVFTDILNTRCLQIFPLTLNQGDFGLMQFQTQNQNFSARWNFII